jgi:hypothetical protein
MIEYSGTTPSTCVTIRNRYSVRTISVISMCIHTYETNSSVNGNKDNFIKPNFILQLYLNAYTIKLRVESEWSYKFHVPKYV